ncbi:MAG: hypothetical protein IPI78_18810 [Chitinophagaceae bacterium]|nr:hypothetical protein [Chitinophagaceae bacterium]
MLQKGVLLTERNAETDQLDDMVPMGVIGVILPKFVWKVAQLNVAICWLLHQYLVWLETDPDKVKVGQVLGKSVTGL